MSATRTDISGSNLIFSLGLVGLGASAWFLRFIPANPIVPYGHYGMRISYALAIVFAIIAFSGQIKRATQPWKTTGASVVTSYLIFMIFAFSGIILHRFGA